MVILTHSYPDPDAIASAWGLKTLIETSVRIPCRVIAGGEVLHAENIKFIEMLCPPLELVVAYHPDVKDKIVFVDCQPTAGNHLLRNQAIEAAAVIDHHPHVKKPFKCVICSALSPNHSYTYRLYQCDY